MNVLYREVSSIRQARLERYSSESATVMTLTVDKAHSRGFYPGRRPGRGLVADQRRTCRFYSPLFDSGRDQDGLNASALTSSLTRNTFCGTRVSVPLLQK